MKEMIKIMEHIKNISNTIVCIWLGKLLYIKFDKRYNLSFSTWKKTDILSHCRLGKVASSQKEEDTKYDKVGSISKPPTNESIQK